jgi:hypothetical protein
MAARSPRRTFANPFVITLATITPLSAGSVLAEPDAKPAPPTKTKNPPPPKPDPKTPPIQKNPPPPKPEPKLEVSSYDRRWTVTKIKGKADCLANPEAKCPKVEPGKPVPTCNPPAPIKYACPSGMADGETLKIVMRAGATECFQERGPWGPCPPGRSCNPPPPRKLACPR